MRQHPAVRDITLMAGVVAAMDAVWFAVFVLYVIKVNSVFGTVTQGAEALGELAGGILAAAAGIRAPMLAGAVPIAVVTVFTG
jgi:hypothetical protein